MDNDRSPAADAALVASPAPGTRDRLLDAALVRFAREGWGGTSIRDLAADVGIRESSVYKHVPSKRALFDALLDRADARLATVADALGVSVASPEEAVAGYAAITADRLVDVALGFFDAVLHDDELAALRRMLVVAQYRDPEAARRLRDYWIDRPLAFQSELFARLAAGGAFRPGLDPDDLALAFFAPILVLLQLAEGGGEAEAHARRRLAAHVRHFVATHEDQG